MKLIIYLLISGSFLSFSVPSLQSQPLTYEGSSGIGKGKHIVFIASDHEYRGEETLPALARILAKHHGFKCTVVFGVNQKGEIEPGANNVPGIEHLKTADLMVVFTRFQSWPTEQMQHFVDYLDRGGPIVGLRTSTHGFLGLSGPFGKYNNGYAGDEYKDGFGRQVLGEKWAGHYGKNQVQSTRLDIVPEKKDHPILRGVKDMWAQCGGYKAKPLQPSEVLAMAQPLEGMTPDAPPIKEMPPVPGAWTRAYSGTDGRAGRVFTSTYGASNDILSDGYRRLLINGCIWAVGLEDKITPELKVDFVGPYQPTWGHGGGRRAPGTRPEDLAGWDTPIVPLAK